MLFRFFCPLVFPDRPSGDTWKARARFFEGLLCFSRTALESRGEHCAPDELVQKSCWGAPLRNLLCRAQDVPPPRAPYRSNLLLVLLVPLQHRRVTESLLADPYYGSSTAFDKAERVGPDPRSHRRAAAASAGRIVFCVHVLVHWKRRDACSCKNKLMHTM